MNTMHEVALDVHKINTHSTRSAQYILVHNPLGLDISCTQSTKNGQINYIVHREWTNQLHSPVKVVKFTTQSTLCSSFFN